MAILIIFKYQVSEITRGLDEGVEGFRSRELKAEYPFFLKDAMYEKVRF